MPGLARRYTASPSLSAILALISAHGSLILFGMYLITMAIYGLLGLIRQTQAMPAMTVLTIFVFCGTSLAHLFQRRGLGHALWMTGTAFAVTLGFEMVGVSTGQLFGQYTYTSHLGPQLLGLVPLVIPVAWLMMLYPAYETAGLLVPRSLQGRMATAARILIAACAMTAWDLSLDPRMVGEGSWIWRNGGPYFGIPLSNFAGWLLTAAVIYALWAMAGSLHLPRKSVWAAHLQRGLTIYIPNNQWATLPIYAYIVTWLAESSANVLVWGTPLVGLACFVGMGLFGLPAMLLLLQRERHAEAWLSAGQLARRWLLTKRK